MGRFGICCLALLLSGSTALAQESFPKVEVFGGYLYSRSQVSVPGSLNASGWATSVSGNFCKNFGLTADFSGQYGGTSGGFSALQYTAGPRFTLRDDRWTFFAHGLFGARRLHGGQVTNTTKFAMDAGAGVDLKLGERTAFRVVQFDYVPARRSFGGWFNNYQVRTGIVFTFGGE